MPDDLQEEQGDQTPDAGCPHIIPIESPFWQYLLKKFIGDIAHGEKHGERITLTTVGVHDGHCQEDLNQDPPSVTDAVGEAPIVYVILTKNGTQPDSEKLGKQQAGTPDE